MQAKYLSKATDLAKNLIAMVVKKNDVVIDATVGNGNDILFLCDLVGEKGKVIGFDIQDIAIENTEKKLRDKNMIDRVMLINSGHEKLKEYVDTKVSAIMFNLGYLPGKNHEITTKYKTTIEAVKQGIDLLEVNGIMTIAIYPGHKEGLKEKEELLKYLSTIDQKQGNVLKMEFINQINNPPLLIAIEKK
ncbi:tRNA (mnm(5)s(2)U34)-methyltransferase [Maledivibacter halophilus]|uniref:Predicted S-adenosylmethionine-dependent methyltransferase involved in cell envelope biogenesis n=1 Tax=Maledivibacter halophilus TaxID=36842 RepID=A0A1T5LA35_9FIRM|nr:class I SAM-dependent methyltransferase [Maledivibacter halophilus]SKC72841.1 Predicted S-adenosylmethionine-dependent methyltransferase involved in cell envelope biogenesis [Maledivibacter halophilus]